MVEPRTEESGLPNETVERIESYNEAIGVSSVQGYTLLSIV